MTDWGAFPTRPIDTTTALYRIHQRHLHPAWFNTDGSLRFDPPPSHRDRFGVCYLGLGPLAAYVEVFGRIRAVPQAEFDRRRLSKLTISRVAHVADLTQRAVLGTFGITAGRAAGTSSRPRWHGARNPSGTYGNTPRQSSIRAAIEASRRNDWSHPNR